MEIYPGSPEIPFITTAQMIEVDRAMMADYQIGLIHMMENAGRNLAHLARLRFLEKNPIRKRVTILAGPGGNGGGAMVCARRLHNWGASVQVFTTRADQEFKSIPAHQLKILHRMNLSIKPAHEINQTHKPDHIIDGVIGYSLSGNPRGTAAQLIEWANTHNAPILALDVPSGIDTTTGQVFQPAILATATMTLALPKAGFLLPKAKNQIGELYLADISIPPQLYSKLSLELKVGNIFAENEIIRLW